VESLLIYLLNRDVVHLIDEYTARHDPSPFCPFMIMDKCIINSYKPSACQMYMPFDFDGEPACFYLAGEKTGKDFIGSTACNMHSNSYAVHGFMLLVQQNLDPYLEQSWFKNIYDGTSWWQEHYDALPRATKTSMEAIINEDAAGLQQMEDFEFETSLAAGMQTYNDTVRQHEIFLADSRSRS
jgi:Fe-S-cluster containining protein